MLSYIDFHAHVLPGADHGSNSVEMSLRQLERARKAGVETILATPHFYPDRHHLNDFLEVRRAACEALYKMCDVSLPRIWLGAEALLCEGLEHFDGIERLCIQDTNILLLEMPFNGMNERLFASMYELQDRVGLRVLLAHIDRYHPDTVREALATGARAQLNADGICSLSRRKSCLYWIRENVVDALGSDVHRDGNQYRKFRKAIKILKKDADMLLQRMKSMLPDQKVAGLLQKDTR